MIGEKTRTEDLVTGDLILHHGSPIARVVLGRRKRYIHTIQVNGITEKKLRVTEIHRQGGPTYEAPYIWTQSISPNTRSVMVIGKADLDVEEIQRQLVDVFKIGDMEVI